MAVNSELFEVRQTQGRTQYIPSVRNTDPTRPSPPEELDYPKGLNKENLPACKCTPLDSHTAQRVTMPESFSGNPLNDPENPRYGSADEAGVVAERRGFGGGAETVRATFDGETIEPCDEGRLQAQLKRVYACCSDGKWRTLGEIAETTGDPLQSVSARLRDLRKPKFGGYTVNRRRRGAPSRGVFEYQLIT